MANMPYKFTYDFEGNSRRRREQNLSGASRKETREVLLSRAHDERQKRQEQRLKLKSIITIQAYIRSFLTRTRAKAVERHTFDVQKDLLDLKFLLRKFLFFYDERTDPQRMVIVCERLLAHPTQIVEQMSIDEGLNWSVRRFLTICMRTALKPTLSAIALHVIDVYTATSTTASALCAHLINAHLFRYLRKLLDATVDVRTLPDTRILALVDRSLNYLGASAHAHETDRFWCEFCTNFLCAQITPAIQYVLEHMRNANRFPFARLIDFINEDHLQATNNLLYCILLLEPANCDATKATLIALSRLSWNLHHMFVVTHGEGEESDEDVIDISDDEIKLDDYTPLLNQNERVKRIIAYYDEHSDDPELLNALVQLCHNLLLINKDSIRKYMLLFMLSLKATFLNQLWQTVKRDHDTLTQIATTNAILHAWNPAYNAVAVFCHLFTFYTHTLTESESTDTSATFTAIELNAMATILKTLALNLIDLAFPMCKTNMAATAEVLHLYNATLKAVHVLYDLDVRKRFTDASFWTRQRRVHISRDLSRKNYLSKVIRPFCGVVVEEAEADERLPPLSTIEQRSLCTLQQLPFLVDFNTRVLLLREMCRWSLGEGESVRAQRDFLNDATIVIRRTHLYEDAFEKLSRENESDLRQKLRIKFINNVGLEEAGIDGGGIFKEFVNEVLRTSFDPNRGFFLLTNENQLYPNPNVELIVANFSEHYYFIGRLVGKAIFENVLVDLPLAEFFLVKVLWERASAFYLHSLDPILYRNLLYLRDYGGDVQDLGLDFTVISNDLGETKVMELKPNGANISVTNYNRVEYIHRLTDWKLNAQIKRQCAAFREGLNSVVPLLWLRLFNQHELQVIIGGDTQEINVSDMRAHTTYGGEFTADHPTIALFWDVVNLFTEVQKKQLLKFVTSCSRPPLLGFKELNPPFCIQSSGTDDRMPTASTCLNLLKLPVVKDAQTLKSKLLASIEQQAGFELS